MPAKIIKVSEAEPEVTIGPLPMDPSLKISPAIRVTPKAEVRELDPKLMSHLGYMNRNRRPLSSKVKEELSKVDLTKKSSKFHEAKKRHSN
jgi:hypothetical protein